MDPNSGRDDLCVFFEEYAMREEKILHTHQRVLTKVLLAHEHGAIMLPMGHAKSFVDLPIEQREKVQAMNRHERRKWAAEMRHKVMAIPMHEALFPNSKYRDP